MGALTFVKEFNKKTGAFYINEKQEKDSYTKSQIFGEKMIKNIHSVGYLQQM